MNIAKTKMNQMLRALLIVTLLIASFATMVSAQEATGETTNTATQSTQVVAKQVTGTLEGGKFAKIWLELRPDSVGARVTLVADYSSNTPQRDGAGFFVLNANQFATVVGGGSLTSNNAAAGNPSSTTQDNQLEAVFNADLTSPYTLVIVNDGANALSFTLTATNAMIVDGSGQVKDPTAPAASTGAAEAPAAVVTEAATPEPTEVAATEATTTTVQATAEATPAATTAAAPAAAPSAVLRTDKLEGELPKQYDQHFLGLEPSQRDGAIKLSLGIDPQDNSEVLRKVSFLVLNEDGFKKYIDGAHAADLAIAAGNRVFDGPSNLRVASFNAVGSLPMTVIVYNNSEFAASYQLSVEGATLVDDAGQTMTAQKAAPATSTAAETTAVEASTTTTTTTAAAPAAKPAAATAANAPKIGSSYTIKSGDSISKIARDVYGDVQLYDELCAYNKIANCNSIEVGDVIQLPAASELGTGATTSAKPTPAKAPAAAASTTVTKTEATTTTATSPVTSTTEVTATTPVTATSATTETATSSTESANSAGTIIGVLTENGNFSILLALLKAAGLETNLDSDGAFTLFAPTDAAFNALPAGAIDQLKRNPQGQLRQILLFHVLSNSISSSELKNGAEATTLQGGAVKFEVGSSQVKVQDSVISPADVAASNGVIHVIDKVMLPPAQ